MHPAGFAVAGPRRDEWKANGKPGRPSSPDRGREHSTMSEDIELQRIREGVSCAVVLERMGGWRLDRPQSTRRALKYRRGEGEILIVNHNGRGWWDPTSMAKGDVFNLVQHLNPALNFGWVRHELRRLVGIAPSFPAATRERRSRHGARPVAERWAARAALRRGSPAWSYLAGQRHIPPEILAAAAQQDAVREGYRGSAWFAHRRKGKVCHVEVRGPEWKGSLTGGTKTLFPFGHFTPTVRRAAVTEAPIDALSLAALEGCRADTLYVATGGGIGQGTTMALTALLARITAAPDACHAIGTDANTTGDRYAEQIQELGQSAGVPVERLRPPDGLDWNDILMKGRGMR